MSDEQQDDPLHRFMDPLAAQQAEESVAEQKQSSEEEIQQYLERRRRAYATVFGDADSDALEIVMVDLAAFCRQYSTTFHENPVVSGALQGRREVFMRIFEHTNLSAEDLFKLYVSAKQ